MVGEFSETVVVDNHNGLSHQYGGWPDHLVSSELRYNMITETMRFQVNQFQRETSSNLVYNYVTNSSARFTSTYDGVIGIKPRSNNINSVQSSNFLRNLNQNKMIDYEIVSIYTRGETGNSSLVKFGGWDQSGMYDGEKLQMFRTHSASDLSLFFNHAKIGKFNLPSSTIKRRVHLNPANKFIYMPKNDWQTVTDYFQSFYD